MFYFALLLIFLGLVSLLYLFLSLSVQRREQPVNQAPAPVSAPPPLPETAPPVQAPPTELPYEERKAVNLSPRKKWIDTRRLPETIRVLEEVEPLPRQEEEQLVVTGILFLDHSRELPLLTGRSQKTSPGFFNRLKRAGRGNLVLQGNTFHIYHDNANHTYSAGDLEQILFLKKGVALVPLHAGHPIPVFITEESRKVKEYIKRHTRTRIA